MQACNVLSGISSCPSVPISEAISSCAYSMTVMKEMPYPFVPGRMSMRTLCPAKSTDMYNDHTYLTCGPVSNSGLMHVGAHGSLQCYRPVFSTRLQTCISHRAPALQQCSSSCLHLNSTWSQLSCSLNNFEIGEGSPWAAQACPSGHGRRTHLVVSTTLQPPRLHPLQPQNWYRELCRGAL